MSVVIVLKFLMSLHVRCYLLKGIKNGTKVLKAGTDWKNSAAKLS